MTVPAFAGKVFFSGSERHAFCQAVSPYMFKGMFRVLSEILILYGTLRLNKVRLTQWETYA